MQPEQPRAITGNDEENPRRPFRLDLGLNRSPLSDRELEEFVRELADATGCQPAEIIVTGQCEVTSLDEPFPERVNEITKAAKAAG